MNGRAHTAILTLGLACFAAVVPAYPQSAAPVQAAGSEGSASSTQAEAYYNYAMAHLYSEEAAKFGGRAQFVNQAIDYYQKAMALDPTASVIGEELAEFYLRAGNAEKAVDLANSLIKANPNNGNAHKILARMYAAQLDPDQGKVDEGALRSAIEHYQKAADIDPTDAESLSSLARLYRVAKNDAAAEKAYKAVIALDNSDGDALTGLAELYAGRGDFAQAIALLEPVTGEDADPNTTQVLAELYEQNHDFGKAADTWKRLLPIANGTQVRHKYCDDLLNTNRVDETIAAWTDLAAAEPKNVEDLIKLTELWINKRNFAKAHEVLNQAKAIENSTEVRMSEAELMDAEGKTADGIATVEELLKETKKMVYSDAERVERINMLTELASMQKNADKISDAVVSFRQIADLNPQKAPAVEATVIETLVEAKDFKSARATADAALKKFTGDKGIAMEHAALLATLGEYDKSIGELKALPDSDKDFYILRAMSDVQEKAKRYKDALATLDAADIAANTPDEKLDIIFRRGAMYEHQKEYDEAEKQFRSVLKADPDNAGALNYLGYMLADRNVRLDEAQQLISKAVDLDPDNGAFLDSLGWVHFRQNRLDQAADELRQALDSRSDRNIRNDPTVHDHLGEVYFKQGKFREAAQEWELSVSEMKTASPSEMDAAELKRIEQRLDDAKAKANSGAKK